MPDAPGLLVLVVGPSGAGKDTLIDAARALLDGDPRVRFARRVVTRPPAPAGEQHEAMDAVGFAALREADGLALCWEAHGLLYGIRRAELSGLDEGHAVVASVSRTAIAEARARYRVRVVEVTAPPEVLAARLLARGREGAADAAARLARSVPLPADLGVTRISNDGTVAEGAARLLLVLLPALRGCPGGAAPP